MGIKARHSGFMIVCGMLSALAAVLAGASGSSRDEILRQGERMYREGILPSGQPMQGLTQGDIPVDGRMFSCATCHLRSGLGSLEGSVLTLPVNGAKLFQPLSTAAEENLADWETVPESFRAGHLRPAYTDATLARVLREGINPAGNKLNATMPRYKLDDADMAVLVEYLKNLSTVPPPGVTDTTLTFAIVFSPMAPAGDRAAMLATLNAYLRDRGTQTRDESERARRGVSFMRSMYTFKRQLELVPWELTGPPSTWRDQLGACLRQKPVFALLGGLAPEGWAPIHAFCEENRLPCLLPVTDLPVVSASDWYTIYFSKGVFQEGETAARYLRHRADVPPAAPIVQVYRDEPAGRALADGFSKSWRRAGRPAPIEQVLPVGEPVTPELWKRLAARHPDGVWLVWLGPAEIESLPAGAGAAGQPRLIFLSASLLGPDLARVPEQIRPVTCLSYPYSLPEEKKNTRQAVEQWLRIRQIPLTSPVIQYKMYFLGWLLSDALLHMRRNFYREYFLDVLGMTIDQTYSIAAYPRLSFGPGQRYASKGCYVVQMSGDAQPRLIRRSDWVVF